MKPLTVAYRDTRLAVAQTLNQSNLPIDMVVSILKDLHAEAQTQAEMLYQQDLEKMKAKEKQKTVEAKGEENGNSNPKRN